MGKKIVVPCLDVIMIAFLLACVAWRFWLLSNKGGRGPARQNRHATQAIFADKQSLPVLILPKTPA